MRQAPTPDHPSLHGVHMWIAATTTITCMQVKAGADVGARDAPGGYAPLHLAADAGQGDAVAALAALGAPLEARSAKGLTPLALATFKARSWGCTWRR